MVMDRWPAAALLVLQTGQAERLVTLAPQSDLVVVHVDQFGDSPIRLPVGGQQDNARPLATRASTVFARTRASSSPRSPRRSFNGGKRMCIAKHITVSFASIY
jgi:hypothetical protein